MRYMFIGVAIKHTACACVSSLVFQWEHELFWVDGGLIWSPETADSIEDRMPKLADIISVHHSCRVESFLTEFEFYSVWHSFPDRRSLLFRLVLSSFIKHMSAVMLACHDSRRCLCVVEYHGERKRFWKDSKLFVLMFFNLLSLRIYSGKRMFHHCCDWEMQIKKSLDHTRRLKRKCKNIVEEYSRQPVSEL